MYFDYKEKKMEEEQECENAVNSVDGTKCDGFAPWKSCPAGYWLIYTPENCPVLSGEKDWK